MARVWTRSGQPWPLNYAFVLTRARGSSSSGCGPFGTDVEAGHPSWAAPHIDGGPNGVGMSGTVTVQAPGTILGPGPAQPQPVVTDKTAPALKLGGRGNQKVLRQRSVAVAVEADEASMVVARGTISVPGSSTLFATQALFVP